MGKIQNNFMKKTKQNQLIKDDEILRIEGATENKREFHKWEFRPITALTVSWMQRNDIFGDKFDLIWKSGAYAFLHSAPFTKIRPVVNDRELFSEAVDLWISENLIHHNEIAMISEDMNEAFKRYSSALFTSRAGTSKGYDSGN
jgi:hypothetical protein